MTFNLNATVAALVPQAIVDRVQNGVDTEFSKAVDDGLMEETAAWRGKLTRATESKPETVKISRTLKSKWTLSGNAPGRFILLSVHLDRVETDCGMLGIASLPDFATSWFTRLENERVKAEANNAETIAFVAAKAKKLAEEKAKDDASWEANAKP